MATFIMFVAAGVVSGLPITPILLSSLVNFVSASFASGAKEASLVFPNRDVIKAEVSHQLFVKLEKWRFFNIKENMWTYNNINSITDTVCLVITVSIMGKRMVRPCLLIISVD